MVGGCGVGLAIGSGCSVLVHLLYTSFNSSGAPEVIETEEEKINEIKYIRLRADLTFLRTNSRDREQCHLCPAKGTRS